MAKKRVRVPDVERFRVRWAADLNTGVAAGSVSVGSRKLFWWRCQDDPQHVWQSCPKHLARRCPICRPSKPRHEDSLAARFPHIACELDADETNQPTAEELYPQSNKILAWLCPNGHKYSAKVVARTKEKLQCPECVRLGLVSPSSRRRSVSLKFNLLTEYPHIAKELHPSLNGTVSATDIPVETSQRMHWICPRDSSHTWIEPVRTRTRFGTQCPECVRLGVVSHKPRRRTVSRRRVWQTATLLTEFPGIAKELHPTLNGTVTAEQLAPGSGKRVYWVCSRNPLHVWPTSVANRTVRGSNCPYCFNQTSKNELRIYAEMKAVFSDVQHRSRSEGAELDVWIESLRVGIEYDGSYWHSKKIDRDAAKQRHFCEKEIYLIRVREHPLAIETPLDLSVRGEICKQHVDSILGLIREATTPTQCQIEAIDRYTAGSSLWDEEGYQSLLLGRNRPPHERSLAAIPNAAKTWDLRKNAPLTPADVWAGSNDYAWFACEVCEKSFEAKILKRVSAAHAGKCRRCVTMLKGSQRLAEIRPALFAQLAPGLNPGIDLPELRCRSNRVVWWRCPKNQKHLWQASVAHRFEGTKCPFCSNKIIDSENSLLARRPQLARRWDRKKNGELTPNQVAPRSGKTVWWTCPRNRQHSFEASICNMVRNPNACPYCNGKKVNETNSLEALFPKIAAEWHPTKNKPLMPSEVATQSGKKVWWRCGKNPRHAWQMTVQRRVVRGAGCPKCRAAKKK
jgi:hypothetical protein